MQIVFDMDGTIANLYGVDNWLYSLQNSMIEPYANCNPLLEMPSLVALLEQFRALGGIVTIVSWTAKNGSKEYNKAVRKTKIEWLKKYNMPIDHYHIVKYGTKKWYPLQEKKETILFDDNADVRESFISKEDNRIAFDEKNILEIVGKVVDKMRAA